MHKLSEGVILALKYYERVNIQWVYGSQIDLKIYYDTFVNNIKKDKTSR